jgi:hypothetical protein
LAEFGFSLPTKQAIEFVFHDAIAFTHARLKSIAIKNADSTAAIVNQTSVLQMSSRYSDALTASAEHISDEFLSHEQFGTIFPIVTQQQPAAEPLFHRMQAVAHSG